MTRNLQSSQSLQAQSQSGQSESGQSQAGQPAKLSPSEVSEYLDKLARSFVEWPRAPILHTPEEVGLAYENIFFPSEDGVPLEGWYIPRVGSKKIIVCNHPRWFNRSGLPSHLEPWKSFGSAAGNDFEVNFIPDYKILHDAGYNILAYDLRNFGQSGAANGGVFSVGNYESRDVIGSLNYVRAREDTRTMSIGLFSRCVGGNGDHVCHDPATGGIRRRPMHGLPPASVCACLTWSCAREARPRCSLHGRAERTCPALHELYHRPVFACALGEECVHPDIRISSAG